MKPIAMCLLIFVIAGIVHAKDNPSHLIQIRLNDSITHLEGREEHCYADENVLPEDTLHNVALDPEQKKVVLSYFYFKNITDCTEEAVKSYLLEAALLASLAPDRADDIRDGNELIIHTHLAKARAEANYLTLPRHVREKLEQIAILQRPFNLGLSAKVIIPANQR